MDGKLTTRDIGVIRQWVIADRQLTNLYGSLDSVEPTRVVIDADGKVEMVELTRSVVLGRQVVTARRFHVHGA